MYGRFALLGVGLVSLSLFSPVTTSAVDVYTDPVGFITLNIGGTNGTPPGTTSKLSFLGLGMTQLVIKPGRITSAATNELVDANASWSDDQFNGANGSHFIEITSGTFAGTIDDIVDTVGASKKLYTANNLVSLGLQNVTNRTYRIRKHWTIGSVFGPNNEVGLGAGGSAATADNILVPRVGGGFTTYYYKNTATPPGTGIGWRVSTNASADASGVALYPDDGVIIRRKLGSNVSVKLLGAVKLGQTIIPVETGNSFKGDVYPANLTLGTSGLYTGDPNTGLAGSGSAATADNILIPKVAGGFDTYYFKNTITPPGTGTGWRISTNASWDVSSTPIPLGTAIVIQRKSGRPAFDWFVQQPF